jgi:hypothetical protein
MARIEIDLEMDGKQGDDQCYLVSYHCEYTDYLDENNLLDPEQAKALERREKEKNVRKAEKQ